MIREVSSLKDWSLNSKLTPRQAGEQVAEQIDQTILQSPDFQAHLKQVRFAMQPQFWEPAPQTLALLATRPEIAATLLGIQPFCELPVAEKSRELADLHVLASRVAVTGDQDVRVEANDDQTFLLVNVDALATNLKKVDLEVKPDRLADSLWDVMDKDNPVRMFAEAINANVGVQPVAQEVAEPADSIRQIGMIAYCDSQEEVDKFKSSLQTWEENLATFGHHGRTIRICDDSPEPYGSQMRQAAEAFQSEIGTTVEYLGPSEKQALRDKIQSHILASPKYQELGLQPGDVEGMVTGMFGAGPTQNRNLSMLLLQGTRSFQADHDMLPQVLSATTDAARHYLGHERLHDKKGPREMPLHVDLLSQLREAPADRIVSPQFSGSTDRAITEIVAAAETSSSAMQARSEAPTPWDNPTRVVYEPESEGGFRTAAPMVLPPKHEGYLPLSPAVRDGDILVGSLMAQHADLKTRELNRFIYHTVTAGSQWGGEPKLFGDTLLSQSVAYCLFKNFQQKDLDEMARALLKMDPKLADEASRLTIESHHQTIASYAENRRERAKALEKLLASEDPEALLQTWYGEQPKQSEEVARREIEEERAKCASEGEKMAALKDANFGPQIRQKLRDYALAVLFREEINAALGKF